MKKQNILLIFVFLCQLYSAYSQDSDSKRIHSIKNQLELLKIEAPGLDETININISQTNLSNFLLAISEVHNINISVSPDLVVINIVNNFSDVLVSDILLFLVKEYNLEIHFTGNILSVKKYVAPIESPKVKSVNVSYALAENTIDLDLKNDPLEKVFRKIMDETGKNLLYNPDIEDKLLTIYLQKVPLDVGLDKLAESNNLFLSKTEEGFYRFESLEIAEANTPGSKQPRKYTKRRKANFSFEVLDLESKMISVELQNTPIEDVIYTLAEALQIDVFTASPLSATGVANVSAKTIHFDNLLDKLFQSETKKETTGNTQSDADFTYKKEGNIYYFGTKNQLSLKQVELVTMMHRSIQLLDNPSGGGQRRAGRNNSNINSQGNLNQNRNNTTNTSRDSGASISGQSIEDLIPEDIKNGLDIKVDTELNSFIVSGPGINVEEFKKFITYIDKPVPVILIEVMILELNKSAITETGISFGIGDKPVTTQGEFFPNANVSIGAKDVNKIIGNFNGFGALNIGKVMPNFYLDIKAMEAAGTLRVKSTPKLATINGHKAYLSSGETTYYAVTNTNFFGSQIPQASETRNYVPIDAELSLEILPFVSGDGQITLDIQVVQSAFNGERVAEDAPPGITSREFSSIVRMEDEDIVVLGGIETVRKDNSGSGVPFLARIPIIKWLFSKRRREASKRNLNILIKPIIID